MARNLAVGVDFGGTKILAGVVDCESGRLVGVGKKKTRQAQEQDDIIKRISLVIDEAVEEAKVDWKSISSIGIGAAGQVDRTKGILLNAVNIGTTDVALTAPLAAHYGLPVFLGNDVEVATLGELHFGAGRKCDNFVCMFIGTGIGSGIVQNGQLYRGATGSAGEIGHIVLSPYGRFCACGAYGCLETYASRTAIAKQIVAELERGADSVIRDRIDPAKGILRSKALSDAIESKDELVIKAVSQAADFLGMGLATVINFYNPKRIILGGGLVEAVDLYWRVAVRQAKMHALRLPSKKVEIVKAELGDYSGIIGAALLTCHSNSATGAKPATAAR